MTSGTANDLVLFAYDGSEYAKEAIRQAGNQLRNGRRAVVLTVWEPVVPLALPGEAPAGVEDDIERDARRVAAEGAGLARTRGFNAEPIANRGAPVWQRIVDAAEDYQASIIVMGSHGRTGIELVLLGSVASVAARHTNLPVLIVHSSSGDSRG
jgi:nucleotide-binding universal stress UspA family protein